MLVEEEEVSPPPPLAAVSPPSIIGDDAEQSARSNEDIDIVGEEVNTIVPTKTAATAGEKSTGKPQLLHLYYLKKNLSLVYKFLKKSSFLIVCSTINTLFNRVLFSISVLIKTKVMAFDICSPAKQHFSEKN